MMKNSPYHYSKNNSFIIKVMILIALLQVIFKKMSWEESFPVIKYADEFLALIGLLYLIIHFHRIRYAKSLKRCVLLLIVCFSLGFLSNIKNDTAFLPAWVQFFLDLKIFIIILLFYQTGRNINISEWMMKFLKVILLFNVPLLIFQFLYPDAYFSAVIDKGGHITIAGQMYQRGIGVFWHPSQLETFTCFTIYVFLQLKVKRIWIVLAVLQLLCTAQRQEIFTLVLGLLLVYMLFPSKENAKTPLPVKILFIMVSLIVFTYTFVIIFSESMSYDVLANFKESDAARIVFFMEAFPLATANFPLGSGLGTFGGYSAFLFDSPLYHKLSFDYFYWYREGIWMTDTFYPHFLAETGYIGFICYVLSIVFLFKYLSESLTNDGKKVCFPMCTYMLLCAITSPIMNDLVESGEWKVENVF